MSFADVADQVHQVGGNAQDLEDEANADIVDTLIDDAFGKRPASDSLTWMSLTLCSL